MANPAFMEGIAAAKSGSTIKDNPYREGLRLLASQETADLWDLGFVFQMEIICAS
jgi:hypothetical protein